MRVFLTPFLIVLAIGPILIKGKRDLEATRMRARARRGTSATASGIGQGKGRKYCGDVTTAICDAYFERARTERQDGFTRDSCHFNGSLGGCFVTYNGTVEAERYTNLACVCHLSMEEQCNLDYSPCVFSADRDRSCSAEEDRQELHAFNHFFLKTDSLQRNATGEIELDDSFPVQECFTERDKLCGCHYLWTVAQASFGTGGLASFSITGAIDYPAGIDLIGEYYPFYPPPPF